MTAYDFVDSHCHLHLIAQEYPEHDVASVLERARTVNVHTILCVATALKEMEAILNIAHDFEHVYASVGVHPCCAFIQEPDWSEYMHFAVHPKVVAIGETGLDYFHPQHTQSLVQEERFRTQIRIARCVDKPLIIHTRSAPQDTLEILKQESAHEVGGVMHCFTEDLDTARAALDLGFYISFSGILTFQNAHKMRSVAQAIPLDRILIETDAPYLTPFPFRSKKPNEPFYLPYVAQCLAQLKSVSIEEIACATTENFFRLFRGATCSE